MLYCYLYYVSDDTETCIRARAAKHYSFVMIMHSGMTDRSNFDMMMYVVIIV
jgi:hypothetical protein